MTDKVRVGVISDTHGKLRDEAMAALEGVSAILHAGDVGREDILSSLEQIAPVTVVRGNIDREPWCERLPHTAEVEIAGQWIHMVHDIDDLDIVPRAAGFSVVIFGHSHRPSVERRDGVLYLNPGSAGPRRFTRPISLATLELSPGSSEAKIVFLDG